MIIVEYHPGGVTTNAPGLGRAYLADSVAGTVTHWNQAGTQTSTRALTADEVAQFTRATAEQTIGNNRATIEQRAETALAANAVYLARATPTNAQNLDQIRLLTRECNGIIRLILNRLETTDGTGNGA